MKTIKKLYVLVLSIVLISGFQVLAQDDLVNEGEIQNAQIVIEKNREIKLPKETKVYEFMKWQPERSEFNLPASRFINYEYDQSLMPISFAPLAVPVTPADKVYKQYAKAGFGNYNSPLVDISLVTPDNANTVAGFNFKHLSYAKGPIDGENSASSTDEAHVYFMAIWDKIKVKPSLTYQYDKNYFYGYPTGTVVNRDDIKRGNQYVDLGVELEDNLMSDQWTYRADVRFNRFSDNYANEEMTLGVNASLGFKDMFYLDTDMAWSKYEGTSTVSRNIYRVNPYYRLTLGVFQADLGLSANFQSDTLANLNKTRIFPYINAQMSLSDQFEVFAVLDGGYDFNTMYSLNHTMPYLNPVYSVANTQKDFDLSAGIRSSLTKKGSAEARVGYQSLKNMAIFVNNGTDQSLIDVAYDSESVGILNLGLTTKYDLNPKNTLTFNVDYYAFGSGSLSQVYHRPVTEVKVKGDHELFKKLNVQWQFGFLGGIKAYDPTTDTDITLDPIPKLDLMAHYQIKDQWGAFVSFENILNQDYSRYLFYPQRGIAFKAGLTYRF